MPFPPVKLPAIKDEVVFFTGGLDQKTPALNLSPGHVTDAVNWEANTNGGYTRVGGYELYDAGTPPSAITYTILTFDSWVHQPDEWNWTTIPPTWPNAVPRPISWEDAFVLGATSLAIGKIVLYVDPTITEYYTGTYYLVLSARKGTFVAGETIYIAGRDIAGNIGGGVAIVGVLTGFNVPDVSARNVARFSKMASTQIRNLKAPVPGSGPILGVVAATLNGVYAVFAIRNAADGLTAKLYKAEITAQPWEQTDVVLGEWNAIFLNHEIAFTLGSGTPPVDGNTLTKGAATGTILRVVHETGSWAAGTAAGRFILSSNSIYTAGSATAGSATVTLSGDKTAITLQPNGKYQFHVTNFGGQLSSQRIYGASGVHRAFEFDGTVFVPINSLADTDTPSFVHEHHKCLVLGIGSSILISGTEAPYKFSAAEGGVEKAVGDTVTGFLTQPGNQDNATLAVFSRNHTALLYGTSALNWKVVTLASSTGALPYMMGNLDQSYVFDDRGLVQFRAAQEYGNFTAATTTSNITDFLLPKKSIAVAACVSAKKNQFRMFFSDGTALYSTFVNGKLVGHMPMRFPDPFNCVWSSEDSSGNEKIFAGGLSRGVVFQLDSGPSFDDKAVEHGLTLAWNFLKSPRLEKHYHGGSLEVNSPFYAEFYFNYQLAYRSSRVFQGERALTVGNLEGAANWDSGVMWDFFSWDGNTLSPSEVEFRGTGECYQVLIAGNEDFVQPFTINSMITSYTMGRRI